MLIAATAGSGTASTSESSLEGIVLMIELSMPDSSPASSTWLPLDRSTPGCAPNTSSVRPTRNWSPRRSEIERSTRWPLTYVPLLEPRSRNTHSLPRSPGLSSQWRRLTVLSESGNARLSRPINAGASGSSKRLPLSGPCRTTSVIMASI